LIGTANSDCGISDELRDNAPNLLTSIGVALDLREEPDARKGVNTLKYDVQHIGQKLNKSELPHLSNLGVVYHLSQGHMATLNHLHDKHKSTQ
jgi:hypothetical protein